MYQYTQFEHHCTKLVIAVRMLKKHINPLNAELNPICHLLELL